MVLDDLIQRIALVLLTMEPGQRLPTVREMASQMAASVGSTQAALASLEESGACTIEKRGHLGSFLVERSLRKIWNILMSDPLIIALPLPSNRRLEGLATGIKQLLHESGIDVFLIFVRGSKNRIRALQEGRCHVAAMSGFAAREAVGERQVCASLLSPYTFISGHNIYVSPHADLNRKPLRVLIDIDSADLQRMTELEFGNLDVEYIPGNFLKLPDLLMNGIGDIMIWEIDEALLHLPADIEVQPLSQHLKDRIQLSHTQTALVCNKDNIAVQTILNTYIKDAEIQKIQDEILRGERVPEY